MKALSIGMVCMMTLLIVWMAVPVARTQKRFTPRQLTTDLPIMNNSPYYLTVEFSALPSLATCDPAQYSRVVEMYVLSNVYETLIVYDRESTEEFVPCLATEWTVDPDGLTYSFKIRQGVEFHNGANLTTEDVEYSLERMMIYSDMQYMYEALLGTLEPDLSDPELSLKIDQAIGHNETHVWFNLAMPYLPEFQKTFLQILCMPSSGILSKSWCLENGDWQGSWENWQDYLYCPSPLDEPTHIMCGTGPFRLESWGETEVLLGRFKDYWGGWPALGCRGFLEGATLRFTDDWDRKRDDFLAGRIDILDVSSQNISLFWGQSGVRCIYPLPLLSVGATYFNYNISTTSPYLGVTGGLPRGTLEENGIPPDLFSDVNARKGFAYAIDYAEIERSVEVQHLASPLIAGFPFFNPKQEKYSFSLEKAVENLEIAWNGQLWSKGFTMTLGYRESASAWKKICEMLERNLEGLNPKFHIETVSLPQGWYAARRELPLIYLGWGADFTDPHALVVPFMLSSGEVPAVQGYNNSVVDALIEEGVRTVNITRRQEIYFELQRIYHEDCPSVCLIQTLDRHWERDWVQGWYYNPLRFENIDLYHLWKEELPLEDINMDGKVDIVDISGTAKAFGSYFDITTSCPTWNSRADLNQDQRINIVDIAKVALRFGYESSPWQSS